VAAGLVSFALGTDTAGSGRVPAAFNNIVGLKPSKGVISTRGVVPACRSQDCVSIFAGTVDDAVRVLGLAQGFDDEDPYSRTMPAEALTMPGSVDGFHFGVPREGLEFFGDTAARALYEDACERLQKCGGTPVAIDFSPFREAADLLYQGPWVAERLAALKAYNFDKYEAIHPIVWNIVGKARQIDAAACFEAFHCLAALTRRAAAIWQQMDVMLLPTTGTTYSIAEMLDDPLRLNNNLGIYTNFVNLMDLAAVAVPAGFRPNGLPFGVTVVAKSFEDSKAAMIGDMLHRSLSDAVVGATKLALPPQQPRAVAPAGTIELAVVGAHLSGQPLNRQLIELRAKLVRTSRTAPGYSFYALRGTTPSKPGLVFDGKGFGLIELEIWELDAAAFGRFVAAIPPPLGIGTLALEDGSTVKGFLCEAHAIADAEDITSHGGWRSWLELRNGS
jgi:allophanate hydrolase